MAPQNRLTSDNRFELLLEASHDFIWSALPDGKVDYANKAWQAYTGLTLDELNQVGWQTFIHPEDTERLAIEWAEAAEKGEPHEAEFRYRKFDNSYHWFWGHSIPVKDAVGQIVKWVGISRDITDRKRMEQDLEISERRLREVIQYAPTAIYEIDFRTGKFVSVNDWIVELSGYSREELLEMSAFDLLDEEGQALFKERIQSWFSGKKPDESVEYRVKAKDGHIIYAILNSNFIKDETGTFVGATVVGHDITARKLAEMALQSAAARDAFRVQLSDALRSLADPLEILSVSCRLLGEYIAADRVYCLESEKDGENFRVECDYHRAALPSIVGQYPVQLWTKAVEQPCRGSKPLCV